jgi:hypothetical protein
MEPAMTCDSVKVIRADLEAKVTLLPGGGNGMEWKKLSMNIGFWSAVFDVLAILTFLVLMGVLALR